LSTGEAEDQCKGRVYPSGQVLEVTVRRDILQNGVRGGAVNAEVSMDRNRAVRWTLACGVAGPILFTLVFTIDGTLRAGYDPATTPISELLLGDAGWLESVAFVASGLLIVAFAFGLRTALREGRGARWGPILIGVAGLGLAIAGVLLPDPAFGYPPGTPGGPPQSAASWHSTVHTLAAFAIFGALPVAAVILSRRFRSAGAAPWSLYSLASGVAMLVTFASYVVGTKGGDGVGLIPGWLERLSVMIGFLWIAALAAHLLRSPAPSPGGSAAQT
jgi:hypothetical membrane protein